MTLITANNLKNLLCNRNFQTITLISIYILAQSYISEQISQILYTISINIKLLLTSFMPVAIIAFIASTISYYKKQAHFFIVLILIFEATSNFSSVWYSYLIGEYFFDIKETFGQLKNLPGFKPLYTLPIHLPHWWSINKGSVIGLLLGIFIAFTDSQKVEKSLFLLKKNVELILTKFFAKLIPIFVLGFIANMYKTNILQSLQPENMITIFKVILAIFFYMLLLFAISAGFNIKRFFSHFLNLLHPGSLAFMSGCSLSTMPWTIKYTSKNLNEPSFAAAVIPATTNIQQIGDCIANSLLCILIYSSFYGHTPDFITWLNFSLVFVAARYATVAVVGGAIFLMLPIYQNYLNFDDHMLAIILALNVLLDPVITSTNVMCNGALCKIFENFFNFCLKKCNKPNNTKA